MVFNEASLSRHLKFFLEYYHETQTHLSLEKDTPESRPVQPLESGRVVAVPQVGVCIIGTDAEPREGQGTALRDLFEESSPRRFNSCRLPFTRKPPEMTRTTRILGDSYRPFS
jgi:hypothetical protein